MLSLVSYIRQPNLIFLGLLKRCARFITNDALYLKIHYWLIFGRRLNLHNPRTFNEKLQWLKLYNRKPEYTTMVDKFAVKDYVANIIGQKYIIPTLGVWNSPDEIDFDSLPSQFVLKTTHSGGSTGVIICRDKQALDKNLAIEKLKKSMRTSPYDGFREWPYKDVPRRIIAEQLLVDKTCLDKALLDYKFYCFDGTVGFMMISSGRFTKLKAFDYFDRSFNKLKFSQGGPNSNLEIAKPKCFEEMIHISEKLSEGIPHVRVDIYEVDGKVYFGELTFFDSSGFGIFTPEKWDLHWGDLIKL